MNKDQIVGEGQTLVGKGKAAFGEAVGSERLQAEGVVDQVTGAVQHGYGVAKDAVADFIGEAPGTLAIGAEKAREIGRRGEDAIRERLGDNGPVYVLAGAIAFLGLGIFALSRR
ncbi:MAG TPA: CsbD family protein [Sphingobium sp.]